jgi:hypothetical protein
MELNDKTSGYSFSLEKTDNRVLIQAFGWGNENE